MFWFNPEKVRVRPTGVPRAWCTQINDNIFLNFVFCQQLLIIQVAYYLYDEYLPSFLVHLLELRSEINSDYDIALIYIYIYSYSLTGCWVKQAMARFSKYEKKKRNLDVLCASTDSTTSPNLFLCLFSRRASWSTISTVFPGKVLLTIRLESVKCATQRSVSSWPTILTDSTTHFFITFFIMGTDLGTPTEYPNLPPSNEPSKKIICAGFSAFVCSYH